MKPILLQSDRLTIRSTQVEDLDFVLTIEHQPENSRYIIGWSREQHQNCLVNSAMKHLTIESTTELHQRIGYIILDGWNNPNQSVELKRIVIAQKGKGFGREAIRLIQQFCFKQHHIHRLWLDVKEDNLRAQSLYRSEGFVQEGLLRECLRTESGFESLILMSILRSEYDNR